MKHTSLYNQKRNIDRRIAGLAKNFGADSPQYQNEIAKLQASGLPLRINSKGIYQLETEGKLKQANVNFEELKDLNIKGTRDILKKYQGEIKGKTQKEKIEKIKKIENLQAKLAEYYTLITEYPDLKTSDIETLLNKFRKGSNVKITYDDIINLVDKIEDIEGEEI